MVSTEACRQAPETWGAQQTPRPRAPGLAATSAPFLDCVKHPQKAKSNIHGKASWESQRQVGMQSRSHEKESPGIRYATPGAAPPPGQRSEVGVRGCGFAFLNEFSSSSVPFATDI